VLRTGTHPTASAIADLSKRKLIERKKLYYFSVEKGEEFTRDIRKQETDINVDMLQKSLLSISGKSLLTTVGAGSRRVSSLIISMPWVQYRASAPFIP